MVSFGNGTTGILFVENKGQWPEQVKYSAEIPGGRLFIEEHGLTYSFEDPKQAYLKTHASHLEPGNTERLNYYSLKVRFMGTGSNISFDAKGPTKTLYNYFFGKDESKWASSARAYSTVIIKNLYDGIDLKIYSEEDRIKYDFKLSPEVNANCIQMEYMGASSITLNEETLTITTPYQTLKELIPVSYAVCAGSNRQIESKYKLSGSVVSFDLENVEPEESVVIDPLLIFSTYSGSVADNWGNTATFDDSGNAY